MRHDTSHVRRVGLHREAMADTACRASRSTYEVVSVRSHSAPAAWPLPVSLRCPSLC